MKREIARACPLSKFKYVINCPVLEIVERESTSPLSPAAHLIVLAQDFIAANVTQNISVVDVIVHLGVSRRLTDLCFREKVSPRQFHH